MKCNILMTVTALVLCMTSACTRKVHPVALPTTLIRLPVEDLDKAITDETRPIAIRVQADWCGFCAKLKKHTLRDPDIVRILNEDYHFAMVDTESKLPYQYHGQTYVPVQPYHSLATALATLDDGSLALPTIVLLSANHEILYQHQGYHDVKEMQALLRQWVP